MWDNPVPLLKIPFMLVNLICMHIVLSSPNPPAAPEERLKFNGIQKPREIVSVPNIAMGLKLILFSINLCELFAIACAAYSPVRSIQLFSRLIPSPAALSSISITSAFLTGCALICAGAFLRALCYRHLGRHFTFELSVRKEHKLITDGPYAVVRHPSYAANLLFFPGVVLCQMGAGSWWAECGIWRTTAGTVVGATWMVLVLAAYTIVFSRISKEDHVLREEFKEQWVSWAKRTPYKLVPRIY